MPVLIVSPLWTDGLLNTSSFSMEEDEELESGGSAEFTSFSEDLVAEQLTYMDAVGPLAISQIYLHLKRGVVTVLLAQRAVGSTGACYRSC